MTSARIKMIQTISRVGTATRIKALGKHESNGLRMLQKRLANTTNKVIAEECKDSLLELVYPHVLDECKPIRPEYDDCETNPDE